ncbi:amino acid ABC transporter substrate-binding protein [Mycolicibacterium sp. CH28]|uniref:ABC transporter substrate-binding protein n=1 Tax=Mycolicibacterium sp. CH28 TaxID=2512237 RepID=UPI001080A532|nr:ABC transporter substrate-binding protein [Mycolicibacterium sp. CH28]TGD84882.1 amino acid ABC transporter substrate-binding protein [Mycolicibacterium sp. CH28]
MTAPIRLACLDAEAPPLFSLWTPERGRTGFEPGVAEALGAELGRPVEWVRVPWVDMIPAVQRGDADAVLCGQGITAERLSQVDFTRPYAIFHEGVLVRRGAGIHTPEDLVGRRVAAIENSTNMSLVETFTGAVPVPFGPGSDDVYADMLAALLAGDVDAVVDDDVVFVPLGATHPDYELAFTVQTANKWGIAVAKDRPEVLASIDGALSRLIDSGRLREVWTQWLPTLEYPFGS